MKYWVVIIFVWVTGVSAETQVIEKTILGKEIAIPGMSDGLAPVCEGNARVFDYFSKVVARTGISEVVTCFFSQGVGNSQLEHAHIILSLIEHGEKNITEKYFGTIKDKVIADVNGNPDLIVEESRKNAIKHDIPVSKNNQKNEFLLEKNKSNYLIFSYKNRVPLKSLGREADKTNISALIRLKERVIAVNSYAYEIDSLTKEKIIRDLESWIQQALKLNS